MLFTIFFNNLINAVKINLEGIVNVIVRYAHRKTVEEALQFFREAVTTHIFLWYIGSYGLKKNGVAFYRQEILSPLVKCLADPIFWLVDLTAWGAFKNPSISLNTASSFCQSIENFREPRIQCCRSSDFFLRIQEIEDEEIVSYFKVALKRDFISQSSEHMSTTGIKLGSLFQKSCKIVSDFYECDTGKVYSVLQYLEAFFLIERAILHDLNKGFSNDININFFLPNDELKYYQDELNSFQSDLAIFLNKMFGSRIQGIEVYVNFISFNYGEIEHHRPYNSPGEVIKRREFRMDDVLDVKDAVRKEDIEYANT